MKTITKKKLTELLVNELENVRCFRDYTILSRIKFGSVNKIAVHQIVDHESLTNDIDNALENFERDNFGHIVFYV